MKLDDFRQFLSVGDKITIKTNVSNSYGTITAIDRYLLLDSFIDMNTTEEVGFSWDANIKSIEFFDKQKEETLEQILKEQGLIKKINKEVPVSRKELARICKNIFASIDYHIYQHESDNHDSNKTEWKNEMSGTFKQVFDILGVHPDTFDEIGVKEDEI